MKYLCLVYYNEKSMQEKSQEEWDALNRECMACVADLTDSGHFLDRAVAFNRNGYNIANARWQTPHYRRPLC